MNPLFPIIIGLCVGVATYLIQSKDLVRVVVGLGILSNAVNLMIVSVAYDPSLTFAPILGGSDAPIVDPIVQALVLTAIVIGLGVTAFLLALVLRIYHVNRSKNVETLEELKG